MERCMVLLSTYNGEKYLKEQLDSILRQKTSVAVSIFVRDDGSKDSTKSILREYQNKYPQQIIVDEATNLGAQASFMELIRTAPEADYYAFADQDDLWKDGKIEAGIQALNNVKNPGLYTANYSLCDKTLEVISEREIKSKPLFSPIRAMLYNQVPGCTMLFNRALLAKMRKVKIQNVRMHDIFCLAVAIVTGEVIFDENSYILHRIHEDNVIGIGHKKLSPFAWIKEKFSLLMHKEPYDMSELADAILKAFNEQISLQNQKDLQLLATFKKSIGNTFRLLRHPEAKHKFGREMLSIRAKILFHLF